MLANEKYGYVHTTNVSIGVPGSPALFRLQDDIGQQRTLTHDRGELIYVGALCEDESALHFEKIRKMWSRQKDSARVLFSSKRALLVKFSPKQLFDASSGLAQFRLEERPNEN